MADAQHQGGLAAETQDGWSARGGAIYRACPALEGMSLKLKRFCRLAIWLPNWIGFLTEQLLRPPG